jgi:hypothetical protein
MPSFRSIMRSQRNFWTEWSSKWQTQDSSPQSPREDVSLLPAKDDSLTKGNRSDTRCWMLTLTIVNIVLFSWTIAVSFIVTKPPLCIPQSNPRLNAALKELSSYCQSLNESHFLYLPQELTVNSTDPGCHRHQQRNRNVRRLFLQQHLNLQGGPFPFGRRRLAIPRPGHLARDRLRHSSRAQKSSQIHQDRPKMGPRQ